MIDYFFELICCFDGGLKRRDITNYLKELGFNNEDINDFFAEIHYQRANDKSFSFVLLTSEKKWYTFDNKEYCISVIRDIKKEDCPKIKPIGMNPSIYQKWDTLRKIFLQDNY